MEAILEREKLVKEAKKMCVRAMALDNKGKQEEAEGIVRGKGLGEGLLLPSTTL